MMEIGTADSVGTDAWSDPFAETPIAKAVVHSLLRSRPHTTWGTLLQTQGTPQLGMVATCSSCQGAVAGDDDGS